MLREKLEPRNNEAVSFVKNLELQVYTAKYRLLKKNPNGVFEYTVNGKLYSGVSYRDQMIEIVIQSNGFISLTTKFGLNILWDGDHKHEIYLCDSYKNFVCGLCGNADGHMANDFSDRNKALVDVTNGDKYTKYYIWGSKWQTFDDSPDAPA